MDNTLAFLDPSVGTGPEPPIYVCKRCDDYGLTQDNQIVVGLTLVLEDEDQHDFLKEEAQNAGTDSIIHFPPEGLIEGRRYTAIPINFVRGWESGIIEDWEVKISLVEEDGT